jgi:hypothetical protein
LGHRDHAPFKRMTIRNTNMTSSNYIIYLLFLSGDSAPEIFRENRQRTLYEVWRDLEQLSSTQMPWNRCVVSMLFAIGSALNEPSGDGVTVVGEATVDSVFDGHEDLFDSTATVERELVGKAQGGDMDAFELLLQFYDGTVCGCLIVLSLHHHRGPQWLLHRAPLKQSGKQADGTSVAIKLFPRGRSLIDRLRPFFRCSARKPLIFSNRSARRCVVRKSQRVRSATRHLV